jgi:hypothetical protein
MSSENMIVFQQRARQVPVLQVSLLSRKQLDLKVHAHGKVKAVVELLTVIPHRLLLWRNVAVL